MFDVLVVGGGAAGAAAATTLGRMRRAVAVVDGGTGRNRFAHGIHGFPTRDGMSPADFRAAVHADLARFGVTVLSGFAHAIEHDEHLFTARVDGRDVTARRLVLATGLRDLLPDVPGLADAWGDGVYHCPYCHGWELRDQPLLVFGDARAARLAGQLARLSADVTLISPDQPDDEIRVRHVTGGLAGVRRTGHGICALLADGTELAAAGLFVMPKQEQAAPFAERLGCTFLPDGRVQTNQFGHTGVPGVYAAGDMARGAATRYVSATVLASAAAGAQAGISVDQELAHADTVAV